MTDDKNYDRLPGSYQSRAPARQTVKESWRPCHSCGALTPVVKDHRVLDDGSLEATGTVTYVCPHCDHCHVGTPGWTADAKKQRRCHECDAELGDEYQCPKCSFPRGWTRVKCPRCSHGQPVHAPHWVVHCDTFRLECVKCETVYQSLCIC